MKGILAAAVTSVRNLVAHRSRKAQRSRMWQELRMLSAKRQEETLAFAKSMMSSIEANQLELDAIDLLAEMLSRPGRQVSGREEVIGTLQCLLKDPDYLQPHFHSLESEWAYEKQTTEMVRRPEPEGSA